MTTKSDKERTRSILTQFLGASEIAIEAGRPAEPALIEAQAQLQDMLTEARKNQVAKLNAWACTAPAKHALSEKGSTAVFEYVDAELAALSNSTAQAKRHQADLLRAQIDEVAWILKTDLPNSKEEAFVALVEFRLKKLKAELARLEAGGEEKL